MKNNFAIGRGNYHCKHEPCWYSVRKGATGQWAGDHKTDQGVEHRQKFKVGDRARHAEPVECTWRPIENNSAPEQPVYDLFLGSGTTLIAAEQTGRACYGLEISPAYADVIFKRWQSFAGQQAVLDGDGRGFHQVAAERLPHQAVAASVSDAA